MIEFFRQIRKTVGNGKRAEKRRICMMLLCFLTGTLLGGCGSGRTIPKENISTESSGTETEKTADEILPAWQTQEKGSRDVLSDREEGTEPMTELEAEEAIVEEYERQRKR